MSTAILTDLSLRLRASTAELQQGLERAKSSLKNFKKDAKDATGKVSSAFKSLGGEAADGISRMTGGFGAMGGAITGALKSLKGMTAGMGALKTALISTGIGAIFVGIGTAIAAVTAYLKGSVDGANKLASVTGFLKGIFESFKDVLIGVGRFLVKAFEDPKQAVADLWAAIKENLVNRFEGLVDYFKNGWGAIANGAKGVALAVAGIFNEEKREESRKYFEEMKNNLVDMGKAAFAMTTGMDFDETAAKAKEKFAGIKKEISEIQKLSERRHRFEMAEIDDLVNEEKLLRNIAILREIAGDQEQDIATRMAAATKALEENEKYYTGEIADARELLAIKTRENQISEMSVEDLREQRRLEADVLKLEAERAMTSKKIKNDIERAVREVAAEEKKRLSEQAKAEAEVAKAKIEEEKRVADAIAAYREKKLSATLEGELMLLAERYQKGIIFEEEYRGEVARIQGEIDERNKKMFEEEIARADELKQKKIEGAMGYMDAALQATEVVSQMFEAAKQKELAAAGDNEEKKAAIEKKYAKKQKGVAIMQALINTALGVTKAFGQGGVLGFITGALVAAAGAAQIATISATPLAKGGIAYSPVNALVGEYPSASRDPEVISPLSKLKSLINPEGGSRRNETVRFEIDGYKLVAFIDKQLKLNAAF